MRYKINVGWRKVTVAGLLLDAAWFSYNKYNTPAIYTGDIEGNRAVVEVYKDKTIVELRHTEQDFTLIGIDIGSDGIYEKLEFKRSDGKSVDLRDHLRKKGYDTATIDSLTSNAVRLLGTAKVRILEGN